MQEESNQRRMTMDFSQLHTYTPPQCAPENTGYTYSLSSSYSTAALEFEQQHQIAPVYESPRMSRRSLRLQNSGSHYGNESLADYSHSTTSTKRETRTLRSRKQHSSSNTLSLSLGQAATPMKTLSFSAVSTPIDRSSSNIHESSVVSGDALHSSTLDQSSRRRRTVTTKTTTTTSMFVDGHWEKSSSADHSSTNVNGETRVLESHTQLANGYICKDCSLHTQEMDSLITRSALSLSSSSSSSSKAIEASTNIFSSPASPATCIYSHDRSRRKKTGVLTSVSNTCLRYSKRAVAPVVSLVSFIFSSVLWLGSRTRSRSGKGVVTSWSDSMRQVVSSGVSQLWLLKQTTFHRIRRYTANGFEGQAHSSFCGSMNVRDLVTEDASNLDLNGSLCDDCKGKQYTETHTVLLKKSTRRQRLVEALWSILAYTGYCLLQPVHCVIRAARVVGSGVATVAQKLLSVFWVLLSAPEKAARGLVWFLATGWYQLVSFVCLLNVFFLTRVLPKLWKLLLLLLPLLLLLALWWWGPSAAALFAYLPAVNISAWRPASPFTLLSNLMPASAPVPVSVPSPEAPLDQTPATPVSHPLPMPPPGAVFTVDMERIEKIERQLAALWKQVQDGGEKQDQRHVDILVLYNTLKDQLHTQTDRESLGLWVSSLLEQRLGVLHAELEKESSARSKSTSEQKQQQEGQAARLADLETLLTALAAKTQEVQQKQQQFEQEKEQKEKEVVVPAADPASISVGVQQEDHDALLAEVKRLELELGKIKQDLQGVVGCKGKCEQLDNLQQMISDQVSSQVRKELQALFFGSAASGQQQGELPESLVYWLSQRYVNTPDLQASLAELELRILRNVSLQLDLNRAQTLGEAESQAKSIIQTVTGTVQHTVSSEGLTEEQVKLLVQNALKLYSQDQTGLVDYALESGGGSILSTRCSETYETKTALMSLFGLPLWYFSQSPRVVIQPDVYPGNCWAFKGTQGYLVIRLSLRILPTSFCVEHIPKTLSPTGNITSAPRNFTVFGLDDEYQEEGKLLGNYIYQEDGESLQTFPVMEPNDKTFQIIEVRVLSNWGHPDYTCLYRFRVHGEPRPQ
ncbi:SUN domain-containing protein 1 isoform X3 [Cynoglossus semilaevis]|uniref:Sad1 and UNC84 domain containing 1b n=1 Tax=Cynoglossus semilaevis TaxID=244447 RepID=A0A3P8W6N5_CYNSE|nr:SUN domain-containing protein 1 isoform X3 [Cynoglossus semilaevis]